MLLLGPSNDFMLTYRKVVSSRPVYYSIFEHFCGATKRGKGYYSIFELFWRGATTRDVLLLATLRYICPEKYRKD